jgi:predicted NBD/HSP70 family sugar kinase
MPEDESVPATNDPIAWYDHHAGEAVSRYESSAPDKINDWFRSFLPEQSVLILDVGDLRKKKPLAQKALRAWGERLTLTISNLADLFNPQLVVLAGRLSELFPFVEDEVKIRLRDRSFPTVESLEIEVSSFGKDGPALGGAALVYNQILSVPDSNFLEDLDLHETAMQ